MSVVGKSSSSEDIIILPRIPAEKINHTDGRDSLITFIGKITPCPVKTLREFESLWHHEGGELPREVYTFYSTTRKLFYKMEECLARGDFERAEDYLELARRRVAIEKATVYRMFSNKVEECLAVGDLERGTDYIVLHRRYVVADIINWTTSIEKFSSRSYGISNWHTPYLVDLLSIHKFNLRTVSIDERRLIEVVKWVARRSDTINISPTEYPRSPLTALVSRFFYQFTTYNGLGQELVHQGIFLEKDVNNWNLPEKAKLVKTYKDLVQLFLYRGAVLSECGHDSKTLKLWETFMTECRNSCYPSLIDRYLPLPKHSVGSIVKSYFQTLSEEQLAQKLLKLHLS